MIFKQSLILENLVQEAISLSNVRKDKLVRKSGGAYGDEYLDDLFGGKDRIVLPIDMDYQYSKKDLDTYNEVRMFLSDAEIYGDLSVEEYINGKFTVNKNVYNIGKVLNRYAQLKNIDNSNAIRLLDEFKKDPIRQRKGKEGFVVVISRHPYDIAGASTDRSWTSCMDIGSKRIEYKDKSSNRGCNAEYVNADISEGTLVAYLVDKKELRSNGKVALRRPLSRILLKPHPSTSNEVIAYTVGTQYGGNYKEFEEFITQWVDENLNMDTRPEDKFLFNPNLYDDSGRDKSTPKFKLSDYHTDSFHTQIASEIDQFYESRGGKENDGIRMDIIPDYDTGGGYVDLDIKATIDLFDDADGQYSLEEYVNSLKRLEFDSKEDMIESVKRRDNKLNIRVFQPLVKTITFGGGSLKSIKVDNRGIVNIIINYRIDSTYMLNTKLRSLDYVSFYLDPKYIIPMIKYQLYKIEKMSGDDFYLKGIDRNGVSIQTNFDLVKSPRTDEDIINIEKLEDMIRELVLKIVKDNMKDGQSFRLEDFRYNSEYGRFHIRSFPGVGEFLEILNDNSETIKYEVKEMIDTYKANN